MSVRPVFSGFAAPYEFTYPQTLLQAVSVVGALVGLVGGVLLATWFRGGELVVTVGPLSLLALLVTFVATIVVHEAVHGVVARALGYRVSFGVTKLGRFLYAAYAGTFQQRVSRRDLAAIAVAPLLVITLTCIVGLATVPDAFVVPVLAALAVNTSGVAGDLYLLYYLARVPAGSQFYDLSVEEMLVYEPTRPSR